MTAGEDEEQYRRFVENSLGLMCAHDLDGVLLWINAAAAASLGYPATDGVGHNLQEFLIPSARPLFPAYLEEVRKNGSHSGFMRLRAKDGTERIWMYRNLLHEPAGSPPRIHGHAIDVTDRMRAERALKESEENYRKLFEDAPIAYCETDHLGTIRRVNRAACELLKYSETELLGRHFWDSMTDDDQSIVDVGWFDKPTVRKFLASDGTLLSLEIHANQIHSGAGSVAGLRCALLDLTDRLQAEAKIHTFAAELEVRVAERTAELLRSNADLQHFAYAASHDLRTPLRQVRLYLQASIREHRSSAGPDRWIQSSLDSIERMETLIDGLLRYAVAATSYTRPAEITRVGDAVTESLANLEASIGEVGATIECTDLPQILVDRLSLVQLFQNLIENAIKYRGSDPLRVHISAQPHGPDWLFSVKDNGIGIVPAHHEQIFGLFKRMHPSDGPGAGIGLAICKKIVDRNGGRIWVESELGQGATFYFTLAR